MAIRCAEFDIPAAIGCGEQRYNTLKVAKKIMIDCSSSLIKIIEIKMVIWVIGLSGAGEKHLFQMILLVK